jgi:peroxidase
MSRKSWGMRSHNSRMLRKLQFRPRVETLEDRCTPATFRSVDGTDNNQTHTDWGSAGIDLLRKAPAAYPDGLSGPVVGNPTRPSPREISNAVVDQGSEDIISDRLMSAMVYSWGQFIDHDIDLTPGGSTEPFNISVPTGDPFFDPNSTGTQVINFNRSIFDPATGTTDARQQPNKVTAFLDGSMIYGSDTTVADELRTHQGGRLKTSPGGDGVIGTGDDLLPFNNQTYFPGIHQNGDPNNPAAFKIANDAHIVSDDQLFMAGDVRANENIELTSLHTLFVREHNRVANLLHAANPSLGDEKLYQMARAIVGAELQAITFNEFLPALLGSNPLPGYTGYKPNVNPGVATEFSTAAFRVGHTMLGDDIRFLNNAGLPVRDDIALSQGFFNPTFVSENGISPILKYLATDPASEVDSTIVGSVRNFLFGPPGAGGFDLASLNIQRGREHGLEDYNTMRAAYGLPKVTNFSQITSNGDLRDKLETLYGNVNNIDAWVGALAEDHIPGTSTGKLIHAALVDQFKRLRDGDRFWYQKVFSGTTLQQIQNTSLADIIRRDSATNNLQNNAFFFRVSISGTVFNDSNKNGRRNFGERGLAGRTVQLIDSSDSSVVAETTTGANGSYTFGVFDGLGTGRYLVREVVPSGWAQTTRDPGLVVITKGQTFVSSVDFGAAKSGSSPFAAIASSGTTATGTTNAEATTETPASSTPDALAAPSSDAVLVQAPPATAKPAGSNAWFMDWLSQEAPSAPVNETWFDVLVTRGFGQR